MKLFISTVTHELEHLRAKVQQILKSMHCDWDSQDQFGTETGDLREILRQKIDACDGIIQIVGWAYGAEPPVVDPEFGRLSYTQYELRYAQKMAKRQGKKEPVIILLKEGFATGKTLEELDRSENHTPGVPDVRQQERQRLQREYRARLLNESNIYFEVSNLAELELTIRRIIRPRVILKWIAGVILLLILVVVLLGVTQQWFNHRENQHSQARVEQSINQVLCGNLAGLNKRYIEENYQAALAKANAIKDPAEREQALRNIEYAKRFQEEAARIQQVSIAQFVESGQDLPELQQVLRIESEQGSVQALRYIDSIKERLFTQMSDRLHFFPNRQCPEQAVLLRGVFLASGNGDYDTALADCERMLTLDPNWQEVLYFHLLTLEQIGDWKLTRKSAEETLKAYYAAEQSAIRLEEIDRSDLSVKQARISIASKIGTILSQMKGNPEEGIKYLLQALEISKQMVQHGKENQQMVAICHTTLGDTYTSLVSHEEAYPHFKEALRIQREVMKPSNNTPGEMFLRASLLLKMARCQACREQLEEARQHGEEGYRLSEALIQAQSNDLFFQLNWISANQTLGIIYSSLKRPEEAMRYHQLAVSSGRQFADSAPNNYLAQAMYAEAMLHATVAFVDNNQVQNAFQLASDALAIYDVLAKKDDANLLYSRGAMLCHITLGTAGFELKKYPVAIQHFRAAEQLLDRLPISRAVKRSLQLQLDQQIEKVRGVIATGDWKALLAGDPTQVYDLLLLRSMVFLEQGRLKEVVETVETLAQLRPQTSGQFLDVAIGYASCAALSLQGKPNPTPADRTQANGYAHLAINHLRRAAALGFCDWEKINTHPAFTGFHTMPEFQDLLRRR